MTARVVDEGNLAGPVTVAELPPERIVSHEVIHFFGMRYRVPVVTHWAGTVIAVNVGGAVIPTLMSVSRTTVGRTLIL